MVREIAFDTETTGFKPSEGHRIVEVGAVELINMVPTGKSFQSYLDPKRDVPNDAAQVHGLTTEFLKGKPLFADIVDEFMDFLGDSRLVIHNATFDIRFLNHELKQVGKKLWPQENVFCTLEYARGKFPGAPASLDALCKKFNIDLSSRTKHGALLDAELLAEMYLHLMGGAQNSMDLGSKTGNQSQSRSKKIKQLRPARPFGASEEEINAHREFLKKLKKPMWEKVG
jgi:DNA polymerase III subunit epsilon